MKDGKVPLAVVCAGKLSKKLHELGNWGVLAMYTSAEVSLTFLTIFIKPLESWNIPDSPLLTVFVVGIFSNSSIVSKFPVKKLYWYNLLVNGAIILLVFSINLLVDVNVISPWTTISGNKLNNTDGEIAPDAGKNTLMTVFGDTPTFVMITLFILSATIPLPGSKGALIFNTYVTGLFGKRRVNGLDVHSKILLW